jgi:hypothetical protein
MLDLEAYTEVDGSRLVGFIAAVRAEYLARKPYEELREDFRQVNSVRVVTLELFERLATAEQLGVIEDLLCHNGEVILVRSHAEIFRTADSPGTYIADVVCEVVWQALMREPAIRVEDEIREALVAG